MKTTILALGIVLAPLAAAFGDVDKEELKKLCKAGLSDELILNYVRAKGPLATLSADDVVDLKKAGISDPLLASLIGLAEPPKAKPAPVPASTAQAMAKLMSDPSIVYDGRYFYPRSYFSSDHAAHSSHGIGIAVTSPDPRWSALAVVRYSGFFQQSSYGWGWSVGRAGYRGCGSGGPRACYR